MKKIDFIPISGLNALMHRVGRGDSNYPIEKTGILEIQKYLDNILFGKNSTKANLIIDASKKELNSIIKQSRNSLHAEKSMLGKSSTEIANEHKRYQEEIKDTKKKIENLNREIKLHKDELIKYFLVLKNFSKNRFVSLREIVQRRVFDDVSYEVRKNKKKPKESRIASIIETAIKDGLMDLLRDYRYQFFKKVETVFEKMNQDFDGFFKGLNGQNDTKVFFEKYFGDLSVVSSNAVLIEKVNSAIQACSRKNIDLLNSTFDGYFKEALDELSLKFIKKTTLVNKELVVSFEDECKAPIQNITFEIDSRQKILLEAKKRANDKSFDTSNRLEYIELKLQAITKVQSQL